MSKIESVPVSAVKPHPENMRSHEEENLSFIMGSLKKFGQQKPIVIDRKGQVLAGNGTLEAARRLGWKEIKAVRSELVGAAALDYMIRDNRATDLSQFDPGKLGHAIREIQEETPDILGEMQFSGADLLGLGLAEEPQDRDKIPPLAKAGISKIGAIYELGRHRLLVGDATDRDQMQTLIAGRTVDLLLTDPPYNVAVCENTPEEERLLPNHLRKVRKRGDGLTLASDSMSDEAYQEFLRTSLGLALESMKPGASFYVWFGSVQSLNVFSALHAIDMIPRQTLIWVKHRIQFGRADYQWQHEPCVYGWKEGAAHKWFGDRTQSSVMSFDRPMSSESHPTMKPIALFEYLMANSTEPGAIVLDPFCGSGATVIAAEKLGRSALVAEIDPRYADVIRKRWAELVHGEGCDWQEMTPARGVRGAVAKLTRRLKR